MPIDNEKDLDRDTKLASRLFAQVWALTREEPFVSMDPNCAALALGKAFALMAGMAGRDQPDVHAMLDDLHGELEAQMESLAKRLEKSDVYRFVVTRDDEQLGSRATLKDAIALGNTVGHFVVSDTEDDAVAEISAPWRAASCDGKTLIVNHPGGGQTITPAPAQGTD
ncbi:MAG: hypothetical protein IID31_10185 [Planctomycetes bacterium]|nr:hypothetical protein [Planctomycetota bacterium]